METRLWRKQKLFESTKVNSLSQDYTNLDDLPSPTNTRQILITQAESELESSKNVIGVVLKQNGSVECPGYGFIFPLQLANIGLDLLSFDQFFIGDPEDTVLFKEMRKNEFFYCWSIKYFGQNHKRK